MKIFGWKRDEPRLYRRVEKYFYYQSYSRVLLGSLNRGDMRITWKSDVKLHIQEDTK